MSINKRARQTYHEPGNNLLDRNLRNRVVSSRHARQTWHITGDNINTAVRRRWRDIPQKVRWGLAGAWTGWTACAIALLLIVIKDVESVIFTGPVIAFLGVIMISLGCTGRYRPILYLGAANCAICILFFGLVQWLSWSPRQADLPFTIMGLLYTLASLYILILSTRRAPIERVNPWQCSGCGYLLYGLQDPRCPECGTSFNPSLLHKYSDTDDDGSLPYSHDQDTI